MASTYKCPALKHGVAITALSNKVYYGSVSPCCPSANCEASQAPRTGILTPAQQFYYNQVMVPIHDPNYSENGIDSFDDVFNEYREWVNDDGYIDETVCSWCIDRASDLGNNRLPYTDYTPANSCDNAVLDTDSKKLVFLGPLLLESICNFSCYVCGSGNSTQWASIVKPFKKDLEDANLTEERTHVEQWYNPDHLNLNKNYSKKIKEILYNTDMSSVRFVTLVGGEPLYGKMFFWFLELLDSRVDLSNVTLSFNTNVSIFPDEKILNILRKFKEVRVSLSLDGVGSLQPTTRPGVSWEETNSNVDKWVAFRNTTSIDGSGHKFDNLVEYSILLFIGTTLSVLNVNKIGSILDYIIEKDLWPSHTLIPYPLKFQMQLNPLILTFIQFKPYLDINLIPIEIRKNWLIDKNDYSEIYHSSIDGYNKSILYNTNNNGTVDKCLTYLSIVEKATNTKFSDANLEIYECLQNLNE